MEFKILVEMFYLEGVVCIFKNKWVNSFLYFFGFILEVWVMMFCGSSLSNEIE